MPEILRVLLLALAWLLPLLGVLWTLHRAPDWLEPHQLRIDLAPGQNAILGHDRGQRRDDLWSPSAEAEHVRLLRTASGDWRLENVAAYKQILWKPREAEDYRRVREWRLTPGGQFTVGEHRLAVTAVMADGLTLQSATQIWRYDGVNLSLNGQALPLCDPGGLEALFTSLSASLRHSRPLSLGGGVQCATRLGLAGVAADSVLIVSTAAGFVLRPGPAAHPNGPPVLVGDDAEGHTPLRERTVPLSVGDQLIVGYTGYRVTHATGPLTLAVTARGQRWPTGEPRPASLPVVRVTLTPLALHGPEQTAFLRWVLAVLAPWGVGLFWLWSRYPLGPSWPVRLGLLLCLSLASGALALYIEKDPTTILWSYALAWLAFAGWLWAMRRTVWSALLAGLLTGLLGWGLVAQLQLGIGADESAWLRYGVITAALAGAFGWLLLAGLIGWRGFRPGWPNARLASGLITLLAWGSLALLGLQAVFGNEAGWGGLQPFELNKLALIGSAAAALALRTGLHGWDLTLSKPQLWWRYLWPVLVLAVLVLFALFILHDFSPLVLLAIGGLTLAWAYLRIHPDRRWRWGGQGILAALAITLVLGVIALRQHPAGFPIDLQSDRIQVWAAPEHYPHTGYQLRQALTALRVGGWWGVNAGGWPGNAQPGRNGGVMAVPAVQDDFAPAFFLHRYGGVAGLALLAGQILLVLTLLRIGARALDWTHQNDYRRQALGQFAYFALFGGGGLLAAHLLVSWGTNLGFLPVMGQPMPLLSAAGSHLIFLVAPIIAFALALEEGRRHVD